MTTTQTLATSLILGSVAMLTAGCLDNDSSADLDSDQISTGTVKQGLHASDMASPESGNGADGLGAEGNAAVYPVAHPRIYLTPNRARLVAALSSQTTAATRFKGSVDQWIAGEDLWGFEAWNAALIGQLTGNAVYCTKAVATIEAQVVAAEAMIAVNQAPEVAGDSYLEIGGMVGDLALVYDWCYPQTTAAQRARWLKYADQAVWNVWHSDSAKWGTATIPWTGWATDDPSDNYYYSFLRATMLLGLASKGEDPQADAWLIEFHDTKILGQLIPTFNADLVGGASREGTGYGVAMRRLFELYDLWQSTTGENLAVKTPHTRQSMLAMLHQLVPTRDRIAPTGDLSRDSTAAFFDYHRNYLQELIQLFPNDLLAQRAKTQLMASSLPAMGSGFMLVDDFLYDNATVTAQPIGSLNPTYYAPGIGELYTRSGWDTHATWVNLIAGPYTQSHAHQDQGSLMIYKDGWLAYDAVVDSGSGLTQETTAHGLVRITSGGQPVPQVADTISTMMALHQGPGYTYAATDLTPAYDGNSAVQKVQREMVYLLPNVVIVFDRVQSATGTTQTWQLASPVAASISGSTATIRNAGHTLKIQKIKGGGALSVTSMSSIDADYSGGYRLDESMAGGNNRYLHILSVDGNVLSAASVGDTLHPGVTVQLVGGHSATVTFNRDTVGATLVLDGVTKALGAGVDLLPE
jgi:hypothetical protein